MVYIAFTKSNVTAVKKFLEPLLRRYCPVQLSVVWIKRILHLLFGLDKNEPRDYIQDTIMHKQISSTGYFDRIYIFNLVNEHQNNHCDHS
jgi:hypothetical protein